MRYTICTAKRWTLTVLCVVLVLLMGFAGISEILLHRIHEDWMGEPLAEKFAQEDILYGSALTENLSFYKLRALKEKRPRIVAIGSSRVRQFRASFFKDSFYTMAGPVWTLRDVNAIVDEMLATYTPELVILNEDLWWWNPNLPRPDYDRSFDAMWYPERKFYRYVALWREIFTNPHIRAQLLSPAIAARDPIGNRETYGLTAGATAQGYRGSDGSYQNGGYILHPAPYEERIHSYMDLFRKRSYVFPYATEINPARSEELDALLQKLEDAGCTVIVFLPPFAEPLYDAMMASDDSRVLLTMFERTTEEISLAHGAKFYDFSNIAWIGCDITHVADGYHADDTVYQQICRRFAENPILARWIRGD